MSNLKHQNRDRTKPNLTLKAEGGGLNCDDPQKYPQNLHAQKIFFFLKNPKNIEIQNLEPQKMT